MASYKMSSVGNRRSSRDVAMLMPENDVLPERQLINAVRSGDHEQIRLLLAHGVPVETRDHGMDGWTVARCAAFYGKDKCLQELLDAGADPEAACRAGKTPTHCAAEEGHLDALAVLIEHGADLGTQTDDGMTALHLATLRGHSQCVLALLEGGAAPNSINDQGQTALHLAAERGDVKTLKVLVDNEVDLTIRDYKNNLAVDLASSDAAKEVLKS